MTGGAPRHLRAGAKKVREVDFSSENRKSPAHHTSCKYFLDAKIFALSGFPRGEKFSRAKNKNRARSATEGENAKQPNRKVGGKMDFLEGKSMARKSGEGRSAHWSRAAIEVERGLRPRFQDVRMPIWCLRSHRFRSSNQPVRRPGSPCGRAMAETVGGALRPDGLKVVAGFHTGDSVDVEIDARQIGA